MPSSFSGMSRQRNSWTGRPSGASRESGAAVLRKTAAGSVMPSTRPWGSAQPLPRQVEPSFSRAKSASKASVARLFVEALAAHDVEVKANGFKSKQRCEKIHDASDGLVGPSNRKLRSVYQRGGEVRACGGSEPRECLRRCGTWRPCGGRWAHPASEAFRRAFRPKGGLWGPRSR